MRITANGIKVNVEVHGLIDPALVFLHYWGGSSRTWAGVIRHLEGNHRTIALDFRGSGDSEKPAAGYRIDELASDVTAALAQLKVSRYILVGHSMGGKVAQFVASGQPPGLVGLVLIAPASPHGLRVPDQQRERMLHAYETAESIAFVRDNVMTKRDLPDDLKAQVIEDSLKVGEAARVAWPTVSLPQNIAGAAASISVPTLVIGGEFDQVDTPAALEKEVIGVIRTSRLEVIPGSGHLLPLEAAKEVSTLINSFVAQL